MSKTQTEETNQKKAELPTELKDIRDQILSVLGTPPGHYATTITKVGPCTYRANIYIKTNDRSTDGLVVATRIAHSYYIIAHNNLLIADPPLANLY
jgi:hypothetical protein